VTSQEKTGEILKKGRFFRSRVVTVATAVKNSKTRRSEEIYRQDVKKPPMQTKLPPQEKKNMKREKIGADVNLRTA